MLAPKLEGLSGSISPSRICALEHDQSEHRRKHITDSAHLHGQRAPDCLWEWSS